LTGGGGTGIAGVASNAEGKGIHIINEHSKYKEWEFVYDLKNDKSVLGAAAGMMQPNLGGPASVTPPVTPPVTTPQTPPLTPGR
jgi:hypothetical protein